MEKIMKKYNIVFMAVLFVLMGQLNAKENILNSEKQEFLPYSTRKYIYEITTVEQPVGQNVVIEPIVISDVVSKHYFKTGETRTLITQFTKESKLIVTTETWTTRKASYFTWTNGALVVTALTVTTWLTLYKCLQFVRLELDKQLKSELETFKLNKEHTQQERADILVKTLGVFQAKLQGVPVLPINIPFAYALTKNLSDEEFINFLEKLQLYVENKNTLFLHPGDISNVYHAMNCKSENKIDENQIHDLLEQFKNMPIDHASERSGLAFAYHEAGHALVGALLEDEPIEYATTLPLQVGNLLTGGHFLMLRQSLSKILSYDQDLEFYKNNIKTYLAGGIAMSMLKEEEKLSLEDFLSKQEYGVGSKNMPGSDLYRVAQDAETYCRIAKIDPSTNVKALLEDCYNQTYDILDANKEQLIEMSHELYKKKIIPHEFIYDIAGSTKPISSSFLKYMGC